MLGYVICPCCFQQLPVRPADLNHAIICPTSRRVITVNPADVRYTPTAPTPEPSRRGRWLVAAALVLLLATLLGGSGIWYVEYSKHNRQETVSIPAPKPESNSREIAPAPRPISANPTVDSTGIKPKPPVEVASGSPTVQSPIIVPSNPGSTTTNTDTSKSGSTSSSSDNSKTTLVPTPTREPNPGTSPTAPTDPSTTNTDSTNPKNTETDSPKERNGFPIYRLAKRIDNRPADQLQKDLRGVREVSLDIKPGTATTDECFSVAKFRADNRRIYPGPMEAARGRADLAGLPFRIGSEAMLSVDQAKALNDLSRELRTLIQSCIKAGETRPDPDQLYASLQKEKGPAGMFGKKQWATSDAVPCIQQMLQPEGRDLRRMSVELLRGLDTPASTDGLVLWAVFDVEAENRAAAVDALKARDVAQVSRALLRLIRYPWPRAAEHAAETLVALEYRDAAPDLAALLVLPDPDLPFDATPGGQPGRFQREMVRVNHARNCAMCHSPSLTAADLVRAGVPNPNRELPPPTTPAYYNQGERFVHASSTFLKQDFSLVQPVPDRGLWPEMQRFDYMVSVKSVLKGDLLARTDSPYRNAILFALRELTGKDLGPTPEAWASIRVGREPAYDPLDGDSARMLVLLLRADPLLILKYREFGKPLLDMTDAEQFALISQFQRMFNVRVTQLALHAYLDEYSHSDDSDVRDRAQKLLSRFKVILANGADSSNLPAGMVDELAKLLNHPNAKIRAAAAAALGLYGRGSKAVLQALLLALRDTDPETREIAAQSLAELGPFTDEYGEGLTKATTDPVARVRFAAAMALVKLKYAPATGAKDLAIGLTLNTNWESAEQKAAYLKAIADLLFDMGRLGEGAYPQLLRIVNGLDKSDVSTAALARVLMAFGAPPKAQLSDLVRALGKKEYRLAAEDNLMAADDSAIQPLITALTTEDEKTRIAVAEVLGKAATLKRVGSRSWKAAMDALAAAKVTDKSSEVKSTAATALTQLTGSK